MATKITTGKVRFSFVNVFEPQVPLSGGDPKFSITLLIPKSDKATYNKILAAIDEARTIFCNKNGASALPARPVTPLHDGDGLKDNGEEYGPECKGHWVIAATSKATQKPLIIDAAKNEILDPSEVYSGCYGRAVINFYGYNNVKKGVGCGLLGVQKLHDGEPFGIRGSVDDFDDDFEDDDAFML